jgi:AcrR family transcriptional regulator
MADAAAAGDDLETDGRRRRGQRRREEIIRVAGDLFRERTFNRVSMEDIGEAAGVTGPAVYRHFKSKEQVLVAALSPVAEALRAAVPRSTSRDPYVTIDTFLVEVADLAAGYPDQIRLWYQEWRNLPEEERHAARRMMAETVETLTRLLRRARPELDLAHAQVIIDAAMGVAAHVGHPGVAGELKGEALRTQLARLAAAVIRG